MADLRRRAGQVRSNSERAGIATIRLLARYVDSRAFQPPAHSAVRPGAATSVGVGPPWLGGAGTLE